MLNSEILGKFYTVTLEEMGKVRLMNRIDTKFVADIRRIEALLSVAYGDYLIQEIEGKVEMPYYTKYFDTADVMMFYQHQRGKKNRQKVRMRRYEGSDTPSFVEVKTKDNRGRTRKKRTLMTRGAEIAGYHDFLSKHYREDSRLLIPRIENHFYRITLVDKNLTERITIDTGLEFHNLTNDGRLALQNIGIIEWKRDGRNCRSGFDLLLRNLHIHQSGFSKYCIGMAITDPSLRQNRLKPKLRMINRIHPFL